MVVTLPGFVSLCGLYAGDLGASAVEFERDLVANPRNIALIMISERARSHSHPVLLISKSLLEGETRLLPRSVGLRFDRPILSWMHCCLVSE